MDRKILRLALVIAVSLFVGTVFTGCNDGEDASEPYLLKKEDIRVSQPEGGFAVVVDQLLKVRVESESDEGISYLWLLDGSEIARTKDLKTWERLPDLKTRSQQRNVVLHPEFVNGKYALYTRPQDGFIDTGNGGGIGWALVDDICHAEVHDEVIINKREYHTIKEVKNGEGPHPIKTEKGWLHLAHGVRCCAAGLRYVLYLYMTSLEDPTKMIAEPAGYFMAPVDEERIGDVSNVLFSNGWIADEDGKVYIYYASSDTRMHVAESTVDRLVDYCLHTPADGLRSIESVRTIIAMVDHNKKILK